MALYTAPTDNYRRVRPDDPEYIADLPTTLTNATIPVGFSTQQGITAEGRLWGKPEKFTSGSMFSHYKRVGYHLFHRLYGCDVLNSQSNFHYKESNLGTQNSFESEVVCSSISSSFGSEEGRMLTEFITKTNIVNSVTEHWIYDPEVNEGDEIDDGTSNRIQLPALTGKVSSLSMKSETEAYIKFVATPTPDPINGECGTEINTCMAGTLTDVSETEPTEASDIIYPGIGFNRFSPYRTIASIESITTWTHQFAGGFTYYTALRIPSSHDISDYTITTDSSGTIQDQSVFTFLGLDSTNTYKYYTSNNHRVSFLQIVGPTQGGPATPGQYTWTCAGLHGGTDDTCSIDKEVPDEPPVEPPPPPTPINGECGTERNTCVTGILANETQEQDGHDVIHRWDCVGSDGGTTSSCSERDISGRPPIIGNRTLPTVSVSSIRFRQTAETANSFRGEWTWSKPSGFLSTDTYKIELRTSDNSSSLLKSRRANVTTNKITVGESNIFDGDFPTANQQIRIQVRDTLTNKVGSFF